jgi:hypothetical protein
MNELSRRLFLKRGSLTVAAAGIASSVPGMNLLSSLGPDSADAGEAASVGSGEAASADSLSGPLIAHVKDLSTGEISIFMGENEYSYRDPQMAAKLLRAAR